MSLVLSEEEAEVALVLFVEGYPTPASYGDYRWMVSGGDVADLVEDPETQHCLLSGSWTSGHSVLAVAGYCSSRSSPLILRFSHQVFASGLLFLALPFRF